jgi:hypothetical protein
VPQDPWADTRQRLSDTLSSLEHHDTLVLAEVVPEAIGQVEQPRRRLFRRAPQPPPMRYVQFRRYRDWITGECVGPTSGGGYYDIDEQTDQQIRSLGWKAPDQLPDALRDSPNYRVDAARTDAPALARMAVAALQALGLETPDALEWQRH